VKGKARVPGGRHATGIDKRIKSLTAQLNKR
jgi:hypothetical protein